MPYNTRLTMAFLLYLKRKEVFKLNIVYYESLRKLRVENLYYDPKMRFLVILYEKLQCLFMRSIQKNINTYSVFIDYTFKVFF